MGILLDGCSDDSKEMDPDNQKSVTFDLNAAPFDTLNSIDSWLLHPKENILLVNVNGSIRAFTSVCTHSACVDDWTYSSPNFTCNCHGSQFSNNGQVIAGPAVRNLKEYPVEVDGSAVTISLG
ncbi:MAG: Rieske (2Fe-2S) protein [Cyclobacteriaceae bacterium]|nr:Rieske (2Fe-2S) protein [Cyclobacteriaceae bacterium]